MDYSNITEVLAISIGLNSGLIFSSTASSEKKEGTYLTNFLAFYFEHTSDRITQKALKLLNRIRTLISKLDFIESSGGGNNSVIRKEIIKTDDQITKSIEEFQLISRNSEKRDYLPHISLILIIYSFIILCLVPFCDKHLQQVEISLLALNICISIILLIGFINERSAKRTFGYRHFLYSLAASFIVCVIVFFLSQYTLLFLPYKKIFNNLYTYSHKLIIVIPYLGLLYYLVKLYIVNESQILFFSLKLRMKGVNRKIKRHEKMIKDFNIDDLIMR